MKFTNSHDDPDKGRSKDASRPLPNGWLKKFLSRADFVASMEQLVGYDHFFSDAMRGYIRALQLRFDDAWAYFDLAYQKASKAPESIPNLVRQFLLNIYCFDNALMEAPLTEGKLSTNLPDLWIPELPSQVLDEYPEVKLVIQLRRNSEGVLRLHLGDHAAALEIFEELVAQNSTVVTKQGKGNFNALMMNYLGLAAAQLNLNLEAAARRNMENAALTVQSGGETINQARAAAILNAFYTYLDDDDEASDWKDFLRRLQCPPETVDTFLERARIIHVRCSQRSSLVLL